MLQLSKVESHFDKLIRYLYGMKWLDISYHNGTKWHFLPIFYSFNHRNFGIGKNMKSWLLCKGPVYSRIDDDDYKDNNEDYDVMMKQQQQQLGQTTSGGLDVWWLMNYWWWWCYDNVIHHHYHIINLRMHHHFRYKPS